MATGARYCVHCGAEQSLPTPIAVVAAAMERGGGREAANAATAEFAANVRALPPRAAADRAPANPPPLAANSDQPGRPAYADARSRPAVVIALAACVGVIAIAACAYAVWRVEDGRDVTTAAQDVAPTSTQPAVAPTEASGQASEPVTPPVEPPASVADVSPQPQSPQQASDAVPPSEQATPPVEIKALPPHAAPARAHAAPAPKPAPPASARAPESVAAAPAGASSEAAPAPPPRVHVAAHAAAPVASRWQRLDEELAQCTRADFITRVICGQRARFRYCDGYWGKVAQCPGSPSTGDHGQ